jgi:hypothetical protein
VAPRNWIEGAAGDDTGYHAHANAFCNLNHRRNTATTLCNCTGNNVPGCVHAGLFLENNSARADTRDTSCRHSPPLGRPSGYLRNALAVRLPSVGGEAAADIAPPVASSGYLLSPAGRSPGRRVAVARALGARELGGGKCPPEPPSSAPRSRLCHREPPSGYLGTAHSVRVLRAPLSARQPTCMTLADTRGRGTRLRHRPRAFCHAPPALAALP